MDSQSLPQPLSRFIGREREVAEVRDLLSATRLLTLTGAGGVGKTRLALQVASEVRGTYPDGVWLVDLARVIDVALLPQAIATGLGIREQPGRRLTETMADALRHRTLLLVLDNCEHFVAACAAFVDGLLHTCPALRVLTTSREPLRIAGELSWRVPSLGLPTSHPATSLTALAEVAASEAVGLFVDRAQSVLPGFALTAETAPAVVEICRRLDGIPLAIELATAQLRVLTPQQLAARLDDCLRLLTRGSRTAPLRQQTLRATVEWSYALLSAPERRFFDRLAVFAGGFTLEAAEAVGAGMATDTAAVLDSLARLVDKSLLLAEPTLEGTMRYRLLEPLHQYGNERLAGDADADAVHTRHAACFLAVAERAAPALVGPLGPTYRAALVQLEREHDNLRAALAWLIGAGQGESAQRLGGALRYFWLFQGYLSEGRAWLGGLAALPHGAAPTEGRARVLSGAAMLAVVQGDHDAAWGWAEEAETQWRALENPFERAIALLNLGTVAAARGERPTARQLHEEGVRISRVAGDRTTEALHLHGLSELAFAAGDYAAARSQAEAALALARAMGWASPRNSPQILGLLGEVNLAEGDLPAARACFEESLARAREMAWPWGIAVALVRVGHAAAEQGDFSRARVVFREALNLHRAQGNPAGIASSLVGFAHLEAQCGRPARALRLAGAVTAFWDTLPTPPNSTEAGRLAQWTAASTRALGERTPAALAASRGLTLEEAVTDAMASEDPGSPEGWQPPTSPVLGSPNSSLTPREEAVAALVAQGRSNREIAEELVISERTVESHVRHALGKVGAASRVGLATWALEHGIRPSRPR
jgi:predicted ATPase/DNA-binding CsgD family transcriptional regulator